MTITKNIRYALLLLVLCCSDAGAAMTVYMEDASEIEAESAWRDAERVYVQVNPELILDFPLSEVDIRKSKIPDEQQVRTPAVLKRREESAPAASGDLLDELVEMAGIRRDFSDLFGGSGYTDIERIFTKTFSPELAEKTTKGHLKRKLSQRGLAEVVAWYKTPVGRKIVEADSILDFNRKVKTKTYVTTDSGPAFRQRMELVGQIDKATGTAEVEARMLKNMYQKMMDAIPPDYPEAKEIKERLKTIAPSIETIRQDTINGWAYSYRALSLNELRDYLKFLRSANGRKYMAAVLESTEEIMKKVSINMGKELHNDLAKLMK